MLFAALFYLAGGAQSSGEELFAWRVLAIPLAHAPALAWPKGRREVARTLKQVTATWYLPFVFLLQAGAIGFTSWLFVWAPRNGHGLDASLGFLLLPICLVMASRFTLKSPVSQVQWVVVALASIAVGIKVAFSPALGWVTIAVCLTFTVYFIARTYAKLSSQTVFVLENVVSAPVAVYFLATASTWKNEIGLLLAIALIGVAAMSAYVGASTWLSIPMFGLLSYVEPILLVVVALMLGEYLHVADYYVYGVLALALGLLAFQGVREARKLPRRR